MNKELGRVVEVVINSFPYLNFPPYIKDSVKDRITMCNIIISYLKRVKCERELSAIIKNFLLYRHGVNHDSNTSPQYIRDMKPVHFYNDLIKVYEYFSSNYDRLNHKDYFDMLNLIKSSYEFENRRIVRRINAPNISNIPISSVLPNDILEEEKDLGDTIIIYSKNETFNNSFIIPEKVPEEEKKPKKLSKTALWKGTCEKIEYEVDPELIGITDSIASAILIYGRDRIKNKRFYMVSPTANNPSCSKTFGCIIRLNGNNCFALLELEDGTMKKKLIPKCKIVTFV